MTRKNKPLLDKYLKKRLDNKVDVETSDCYQYLPDYQPSISSINKRIKFFFEPATTIESANARYSNDFDTYIGAGALAAHNKQNSFYMLAIEKLGEEVAKVFARMLIKHIDDTSAWSSLNRINSSLKCFIPFLHREGITNIEQINQLTISLFGNYLSKDCGHKTDNAFLAIKRFLKQLPHAEKLNLGDIFWQPIEEKVNLNADFESDMDNSYSDKVLIQILSYTFYEIENLQHLIKHYNSLSIESLGDNYIELSLTEIKVSTSVYKCEEQIVRYLKDPLLGHEILRKNFLYANKLSPSAAEKITGRIRRASKKFNLESEYQVFIKKHKIKSYTDRHIEAESISKESLGDDFIDADDFNLKALPDEYFHDKRIVELFKSGQDGLRILRDNNLLFLKGDPKRRDLFMQRIRKIAKRYDMLDLYEDLIDYQRKDCWSVRAGNFTENNRFQYQQLYSGSLSHLPFLISIYFLITTGVNREVALSIPYKINNKSVLKNNDKLLGTNSVSNTVESSVILPGKKKKAKLQGKDKTILISVPQRSPLFEYLSYLENILPFDRKYFFNLTSHIWTTQAEIFAAMFPIYDDNGNRLTTLNSTKFRKCFAGHKLLELTENVENETQLIEKLQDALNHENFDVTLLSYLFKTGTSTNVLDMATIALQEGLVKKALEFQGTISIECDSTTNKNDRFICECTDPQNPSHDIPIKSDHCTRFDLCLGCNKSQIFDIHIPKIIYRIYQYEEIALTNPTTYNMSLVDKHQIAKDALDKFKERHPKGEHIIESAYLEAKGAWQKGSLLMPKIRL